MYLLFLNSCIFEYKYLIFLAIKLFLCFYLLLFRDMSYAISILWLNEVHIQPKRTEVEFKKAV